MPATMVAEAETNTLPPRQQIYVVTAPNLIGTQSVSYAFIFRSGAPTKDAVRLASRYGIVTLHERGKDEIDPFKFVRGEEGAIGPNGTKRWSVAVGSNGRSETGGSVDESPDEDGLKDLLPDIGNCALLMKRDIFDRFEKACNAVGIRVLHYHCEHDLATS